MTITMPFKRSSIRRQIVIDPICHFNLWLSPVTFHQALLQMRF
jgi:hypothetical protein